MPKRNRGVVLTTQGWQKIQDAIRKSEIQENFGDSYTLGELSDRTGLGSNTVTKVLDREEGVDKRTLDRLFRAFNLELDKGDYSNLEVDFKRISGLIANTRVDWGEAVNVSVFYGRTEELAKLGQWILKDNCRLIALLGMGGIGKTSLSVRLAEQIKAHFEYVIWRSLRNAPLVEDILADFIEFLSDEQETDLPENLGTKISRLVGYLRKYRCLLILDNAEAILQSGAPAGHYREGYEGYGELLRWVGEANNQSCLVVTSREKPKELALLEGENSPVRSLKITGLNELEAHKILNAKSLVGSEQESKIIIERYQGNPLALKIVSTTIQEVFSGNITEFLKQGVAIYGDIRTLLDASFQRLTKLEKQVMYWLAIAREPVSISEVREDAIPPLSQTELVEVLESLQQRLLIEKCTTLFTLQPVIMEYLTDRLVESVGKEIIEESLALFKSHTLIKASSKDYVKKTQLRLILKPTVEKLLAVFRSKIRLENRLIKILLRVQSQSALELGYTGGNVINLLCELKTDLSKHDFSYLTIWQADLRNVNLHHVNFAHSDLAKSTFAETITAILSVSLSPDGILATGDATGVLCLWQVADGKLLLLHKQLSGWMRSLAFSPDGSILVCSSANHTVKLYDVSNGQCLRILQGHSAPVGSVAFNPDGNMVASGSDDQTLRIWNADTGQVLRTLQGHDNAVRAVAFSPDGKMLASGGDDQTVRLWDLRDGKCLRVLHGHSDAVWSVVFTPQGTRLASGSFDSSVRVWDLNTGECLQVCQGHTEKIWSIALNVQGTKLASGSQDRTIRIWDVNTGHCLQIMQGHHAGVWSVAFSSDGQLLVSGSKDQTVRLWDVATGQSRKTLQGYSNTIGSLSFSPNGEILASGSCDKTVKLWEVNTGRCFKIFQEHCDRVWSVTFSPQGNMLASGSDDSTVRIWDVDSGRCLKILREHSAEVWSVAFSPQGNMLASGSDDSTVRIWDVDSGRCLKILRGHRDGVWSVAFSLDNQMLASGAWDKTVKLWDVRDGNCRHTLQGHTGWVWSIAISPDSRTLASGSDDQTVRLWDVGDGKCQHTLRGHTEPVRSVAFHPQAKILASGSEDQTVRLWDVRDGKCQEILHGHTGLVLAVRFSPDGQLLASGSSDGTIRLWDLKTGECQKTLLSKRPYEGMNITGVTGIDSATIGTLKALGAVEHN